MAAKRSKRSSSKKSTTKKSAKKSAPKGRQPKNGGLKSKMQFVVTNFVSKGKTRPEAVDGLLKKYPEMSENYARTICYTYLKDEKWTPAKRASSKKTTAKSKSTKKSKGTKKSTSSSKSRKSTIKTTAGVVDDFDDGDDDFDF